MAYTAFTWIPTTYSSNTPTPISETNLDHLETQYDEFITYSTFYGGQNSTFTGVISGYTWAQSIASTRPATTAYVQTRVAKVHTDLHLTGKWTTAA